MAFMLILTKMLPTKKAKFIFASLVLILSLVGLIAAFYLVRNPKKETPSKATSSFQECADAEEIFFTSSDDDTTQHASLFKPTVPANPAPLLVTTHGWGQSRCVYLDENIKGRANQKGWYILAPAYRDQDGINNPLPADSRWQPSFLPSLGSIATQKDIISAINYIKSHYSIDETKIYISGESMGGQTAMIMAEKYPDVFAAAIDWMGITDLALWSLANQEVVPKIDDNDPRLTFTGNWQGQQIKRTSNNYIRTLNSTGSVSFSFSGNWLAYISSLGPDLGIARIDIDGRSFEKDLYYPSRILGLYHYFPDLGGGNHTATISWTGRKNPSSSSTFISFDGFDYGEGDYLSNLASGVTDNNSPVIIYAGNWSIQSESTTQPPGTLLGGNVRVSSDTNAYAQFTFSGKFLGIIHTANKNLGIATAEIDGISYSVDMGPINQYYSNNLEDKYYHVLTVFRDLPPGNHTAKIKPSGQKYGNGQAIGTAISFDGFISGDNLTSAPYRHYFPMTWQSVGAYPEINNFEYARRSPVAFSSNLLNTPIAILHSSRDSIVDVSQAELLANTIKQEIGKDIPIEDPGCSNLCGHSALPQYRAIKTFEFFENKSLNANPNLLKIKTDESKKYYWLEIKQTGPAHFSSVEVEKNLPTNNAFLIHTSDINKFVLTIDLSRAGLPIKEYQSTEDFQPTLVGNNLSMNIPAGSHNFIITPIEPSFIFSFKIRFQGISSQGPDKTIRVILKQNGMEKYRFESVEIASDNNGIYSGTTPEITPGAYEVFIKGPAHLQKNFGSVNINSGMPTQDWSTAGSLRAGDLAGGGAEGDQPDNMIEAADLGKLIALFNPTGSVPAGTPADLNSDGKVDMLDAGPLLSNYQPGIYGDQ